MEWAKRIEITEHNSRPRNPKIIKACFMAGYIDTWD